MIDILLDTNLDLITRVMLFIVLAFALIMALSLHEFAHAYAALKNGDRTAKLNGRVSLNPLRHLDPIGFAMLMVVGFGYAKPVPVNPANFKKRKLGMFTVSVAGVATNLVLSFISGGILVAVTAFANVNNNLIIFILIFLNTFHTINLVLCFFNLIPIFPLDGFNIIASFLRPGNSFVKFMRQYGQFILLFLFGLAIVVGYVGLETWWWKSLNILGQYLNFTAGNVSKGILWLWSKIFGL